MGEIRSRRLCSPPIPLSVLPENWKLLIMEKVPIYLPTLYYSNCKSSFTFHLSANQSTDFDNLTIHRNLRMHPLYVHITIYCRDRRLYYFTDMRNFSASMYYIHILPDILWALKLKNHYLLLGLRFHWCIIHFNFRELAVKCVRSIRVSQ